MGVHPPIGIVAHVDRAPKAWELFEKINATYISIDDGKLGCTRNHIQVLAWLRSMFDEDDWFIVLEDDAQPCEGFVAQAKMALSTATTDVVSFYLGRSYPLHWQQTIERTIALSENAPWITGGHLLHAVGSAVHVSIVDGLLDNLDPTARLPVDEQISVYCRHNDVHVGYTQPSLVDHEDSPSVIGMHPDGIPRLLPRKAWTFGTRKAWSSRSVQLG